MKNLRMYVLLIVILGLAIVALVAFLWRGEYPPLPSSFSVIPPDLATSQPTPTLSMQSTPSIIVGKAPISSLDVLIMESFPVQVSVTVKGQFSDSCPTISEVSQTRDGNTFTVTVASERPAEAMCAQVITPFEKTIPLDVAGLKAGTYTVNVNGVTETFELQQDNSPIP